MTVTDQLRALVDAFVRTTTKRPQRLFLAPEMRAVFDQEFTSGLYVPGDTHAHLDGIPVFAREDVPAEDAVAEWETPVQAVDALPNVEVTSAMRGRWHLEVDAPPMLERPRIVITPVLRGRA